MDKLSERIGLYDLWVVFFPGIISMFELLLFAGTFWSVYRNRSLFMVLEKIAPDNIQIWIVIIIISIFLGIIIQELGRVLRRVTKYKSAADNLFDSNNGVLTETERACFRRLFKKYGWSGEYTGSSKEIFHRINIDAQEIGVATRYAKLNVLQNMSLSLSASMLCGAVASVSLFVFGIINGRIHIALIMIAILIVCIILMMMFYSRYKRFDRYWVRNIIYAMSAENAGAEKKENEKGH